MIKNIIIGVLVVALLVVSGLYLIQNPPFGASTIYSPLVNPPYVGSGIYTVPSNITTSTTLTADAVCNNVVINWFAREGQSTTTFPTATNLRAGCLGQNGATREITMRNTGWASSTITFSAGTGNTLQYLGTTTMRGGNSFKITFISIASSTGEINIGVEQQ